MSAAGLSLAARQALELIGERFDVEAEFLWESSPGSAAFRHPLSRKWFAVLMSGLPRERLNLPGEGLTDILDVKCAPALAGALRDGRRFLPAYHMNKEHWITLVLDGSIPPEEMVPILDLGYAAVSGKKSKRK